MSEEKELVVSDFPEGWEKSKELFTELPEDQREAFVKGLMQTLLNM